MKDKINFNTDCIEKANEFSRNGDLIGIRQEEQRSWRVSAKVWSRASCTHSVFTEEGGSD